eukprot:10856129-Heterocapsa_arctica.AAC.1
MSRLLKGTPIIDWSDAERLRREGMTHKQIANHLGMPIKTVSNRLKGSPRIDWSEAQRLRREGSSQKQIADHLGMPQQ